MRPALFAGVLLLAGAAQAETPALPRDVAARLVVFADRDDDDADGVADAAETRLEGVAATDVRWLSLAELGPERRRAPLRSALVRWVADAVPVQADARPPAAARKLGLQGVAPGGARLLLGGRALDVSVVELAAIDARGGRVDLTGSHASISRVLPAFLSDGSASDQDALRWVAIGESGSLPAEVEISSVGADARELDSLAAVELAELPCPSGVAPELSCRGTPLIRATADRIDRGHPESSGRSLRAEVGGRLLVRVAGKKAASVRVGGPRLTGLGPIERFRSRLRVHVLRVAPGGAPAVGGDAAGALALVRAEVETASLLWGQCGIHFGIGDDVPIRLVDPPPPHLVAVGCGVGLPATGGEVALRVGKRSVRVPTFRGESPLVVATRLAQALRATGLAAVLSRNARIDPGALETADVLVRNGEGLATVEPEPALPLSSDPSLEVCIGSVDLADGLFHFTDFDAVAGTLEERTLIKAYADKDPATIEVFVVPAFSGAGRVGESFLDAPGAGIHNTVLVDRAAIRAGARSHVLAHELGHVLLDMPGHPDDYGVDQPSALMDADATDPSIFGPRRLSVQECERAIRQRGPKSPAPLLEPWPLVTPAR